MCDPVTAVVGSMVLGAVVGGAMQPDIPSPGTPPPVVAPPTPQAAKTPDQAAVRRSSGAALAPDGTGTGGDNPASTLLTGPGGIDTNSLKLGKSTALGA